MNFHGRSCLAQSPTYDNVHISMGRVGGLRVANLGKKGFMQKLCSTMNVHEHHQSLGSGETMPGSHCEVIRHVKPQATSQLECFQ